MSYPVEVLDQVKTEDMPALPGPVQRRAAEILRDLHFDPRLGEEMRSRYNLAILEGCRRIPFDEDGWEDKPRYRFVFRNLPDDAAVDNILVLAISEREGLLAYKRAQARHPKPPREPPERR